MFQVQYLEDAEEKVKKKSHNDCYKSKRFMRAILQM